MKRKDMMMPVTRRGFLGMTAATASVFLAACGTVQVAAPAGCTRG